MSDYAAKLQFRHFDRLMVLSELIRFLKDQGATVQHQSARDIKTPVYVTHGDDSFKPHTDCGHVEDIEWDPMIPEIATIRFKHDGCYWKLYLSDETDPDEDYTLSNLIKTPILSDGTAIMTMGQPFCDCVLESVLYTHEDHQDSRRSSDVREQLYKDIAAKLWRQISKMPVQARFIKPKF